MPRTLSQTGRKTNDLEARPDATGPEANHSVTTWPEKLRAVAAECDRASEVYGKPRSESTLEERLYPGNPKTATGETGGRLDVDGDTLDERLYPGLGKG